MQLTHFTDLGLRVLMYLTHQKRDTPATISEIAEQFAAYMHRFAIPRERDGLSRIDESGTP